MDVQPNWQLYLRFDQMEGRREGGDRPHPFTPERYEALTRLKNLIGGDTNLTHAEKLRTPVTAPSIGIIKQ